MVNKVLWNFDTLGRLTNQTLLVNGDRLYIDNRYGQAFRRFISGDSRGETIRTLEETFTMMQEVIDSYTLMSRFSLWYGKEDVIKNVINNLESLVSRQHKVKDGLATLRNFQRYGQDMAFQISVERFEQRVVQMCAQAQGLLQGFHRTTIPEAPPLNAQPL